MDEAPVAVDFETEFSNSLSVKIQGNRRYALEARAFLVGIYAGEDLAVSCAPEDAPWEAINGRHWLSHNAGFDSAVFAAAQAKGLIPPHIQPSRWDCTADLSAFSAIGRSLKAALKNAFGTNLEKTVRDKAKGKQWPRDFSDEAQYDFRFYNLNDSKQCRLLWDRYSPGWPTEEREFARIIRTRANAGVAIDQEKLRASIARLEELREEAQAKIPWAHAMPPLSMVAVREFCVSQQIPPPESLAENSESAREWETRFGDRYSLIGSLRAFRKANMYLRKLESITNRLCPDGRMAFGLKYFGAGSTGRLSGSDGWNIQNLPRAPYEGVDIRSLLVPGPGKKFVICDFSQIEPRVTVWITRNSKLLEALRAGHNLYEADARLAGVWNGPEGTFKKTNPIGYQLQKAQTLGIGYGMGQARFIRVARAELGLEFTSSQALDIISRWHARNPGVRPYWARLELEMGVSAARHEEYSIELPSGRCLQYFELERGEDNRLSAVTERGSPRRRRYWGGHLFENVIQACARDVLRDAVLALEARGIPVVFSAHDEVVCEVPIDFDASEILRLMRVPPVWAPSLPLEAELTEAFAYTK